MEIFLLPKSIKNIKKDIKYFHQTIFRFVKSIIDEPGLIKATWNILTNNITERANTGQPFARLLSNAIRQKKVDWSALDLNKSFFKKIIFISRLNALIFIPFIMPIFLDICSSKYKKSSRIPIAGIIFIILLNIFSFCSLLMHKKDFSYNLNLTVNQVFLINEESHGDLAKQIKNKVDTLSPKIKIKHIFHTHFYNAFAAGLDEDTFSVYVNSREYSKNKQETTALIAHEISHIINGDTIFTKKVVSLHSGAKICGLIFLIFFILKKAFIKAILLGIICPFLIIELSHIASLNASFMQEYVADLFAVESTGRAEAIANALKTDPEQNKGMFFIIKKFLESIFSTHPPQYDRYVFLRSLILKNE